jgi:hypothetical protein
MLTIEVLIDTPGLAGGFVVWLSSQDRTWLNGRYIDDCSVINWRKLTSIGTCLRRGTSVLWRK